MEENTELITELKRRFEALPAPVQAAITSADISKRMRELAEKHNLHIDQWAKLENEVQIALLGIQPAEDLPRNLSATLHTPEEVSNAIAADISAIVFEPIRQELERQLQRPEGANPDESVTPTPSAINIPTEKATPLAPATPPTPPPSEKAERAQLPESYRSGASHERKTIDGDPYREQIG